MTRINVIQGKFGVSDDPEVVFATLLGSCVAACIRDPVAGVGGMNHFLLPGEEEEPYSLGANSYGVHLMELLINGLMRSGANRSRLEAKIFGGARMLSGLSDIGKKNVEFVHRFLEHEGIQLVGGNVGGNQGRRVQYWPHTGRARQGLVASDLRYDVPLSSRVNGPLAGEIELF